MSLFKQIWAILNVNNKDRLIVLDNLYGLKINSREKSDYKSIIDAVNKINNDFEKEYGISPASVDPVEYLKRFGPHMMENYDDTRALNDMGYIVEEIDDEGEFYGERD